jgi:hypothetical protein
LKISEPASLPGVGGEINFGINVLPDFPRFTPDPGKGTVSADFYQFGQYVANTRGIEAPGATSTPAHALVASS